MIIEKVDVFYTFYWFHKCPAEGGFETSAVRDAL